MFPFLAFSVVIAAQSAPSNVKERTEVRTTWGENCNAQTWCRLIFVVGRSANQTLQEQIISKLISFQFNLNFNIYFFSHN